jgi:NAD-dependent SIR2 family protein deacetylase
MTLRLHQASRHSEAQGDCGENTGPWIWQTLWLGSDQEDLLASGSFTTIAAKGMHYFLLLSQSKSRSSRFRAKVAQPNAAHIALAKFSLPAIRNETSPGSTFTLITQNVDGLSQRAMDSVMPSNFDALSVDQPMLLEMHGRVFEVLCTDNKCSHAELNFDSPICPSLAGTEQLVESGVIEPTIEEEMLPRCPRCKALARPGVVWFGEIPRYLDTIDQIIHKADLCLVVGTSATVCPVFFNLRRLRNVVPLGVSRS